MDIINEIKGNPIAALAGAAIGYYIVDQKMKEASTGKKVLIVSVSAIVAHLVYVQLTTKKNDMVVNPGLPPVQGIKQTK